MNLEIRSGECHFGKNIREISRAILPIWLMSEEEKLEASLPPAFSLVSQTMKNGLTWI